MKQCQALVEVTLRLCAFCCDLARVRTEPVINRLARVAARTKNKRQNGSSNYMTGGVHNERMTVIGSVIAARSCPQTADELNTCGVARPLQLPEKISGSSCTRCAVTRSDSYETAQHTRSCPCRIRHHYYHSEFKLFNRKRSQRNQNRNNQTPRRGRKTLAGLDRAGVDCGGESRLPGRRGVHGEARARCGISAGNGDQHRWQTGCVCNAGCGRAENRWTLFHVRRETVRSCGVDLAADRSTDRGKTASRRSNDWSRRGKSE